MENMWFRVLRHGYKNTSGFALLLTQKCTGKPNRRMVAGSGAHSGGDLKTDMLRRQKNVHTRKLTANLGLFSANARSELRNHDEVTLLTTQIWLPVTWSNRLNEWVAVHKQQTKRAFTGWISLSTLTINSKEHWSSDPPCDAYLYPVCPCYQNKNEIQATWD